MDRALAAMDALFIPIIQLEMEFDFLLDEHRLAKAVSLLLEAEPILGCRFVPPYIKAVLEKALKKINQTFLR